MNSESELIKLLIDGSEIAFEKIYQIYSVRLYNYCLSYTKSRETAEEVVQDVFVKLWVNRTNIVNNSSIGAFLFVIAKHQLINIYRHTVNSPIYEEYVGYCNREDVSVSDTSNKIEYDDFCRILQKNVTKLSKTQRKIFECCKIKQMSAKEAAAELGMSEQTIKNQLSIAIKFLRKQIQNIPIYFLHFLYFF
ncbi:MAG: RNA polymerase sigma-70 factor [Rikenellaceae bacterium]